MISLHMQGGCLCENPPGLRLDLTNVEIAATIAPRPMLMVSATGDWTKETMEVEYPAVRAVYDLFGAGDQVQAVRMTAEHNYNKDSREAMYAWMARWLQQAPARRQASGAFVQRRAASGSARVPPARAARGGRDAGAADRRMDCGGEATAWGPRHPPTPCPRCATRLDDGAASDNRRHGVTAFNETVAGRALRSSGGQGAVERRLHRPASVVHAVRRRRRPRRWRTSIPTTGQPPVSGSPTSSLPRARILARPSSPTATRRWPRILASARSCRCRSPSSTSAASIRRATPRYLERLYIPGLRRAGDLRTAPRSRAAGSSFTMPAIGSRLVSRVRPAS